MRTFLLVRGCDVSGVSGTGIVAEGVEFTDGTVVLRWLRRPNGTGLYASLKDMLEVHGHGGLTCVRWIETTEVKGMDNLTTYRFSPRKVREAGLTSTVEAKALRFLAESPREWKEALRAFDARALERLERRGLIERQDGHLHITAEGLRALKICVEEKA